MSPAIALFTNKCFGNLFKDADLLFNEVPYNELICSRIDPPPGKVEILIADESQNIFENELTAGRILQLTGTNPRKVNFKDIAVLCRKRKSFKDLEAAFVKHNIPFTIIGGRGFYQQQVVYDVHNYLSFLLNPANDTALVGILRSPFYTIPDTQLFKNIETLAERHQKAAGRWEKHSEF